MQNDYAADADVESWFKSLGVESLCQWDVLIFLYGHQTCLFGLDYLATLMGYATEPVIAALDVLESLGLIKRSRVSQGARLYTFTVPSVPPRGGALERLLDLSSDRAGRLRVSRQLRRRSQISPEGVLSAERLLEEARKDIRAASGWVQPPEQRSKTWRKAI
jgi:hypothetical protein